MFLFDKNNTKKSDQELLQEYQLENKLSAFEALFLRYSHQTFLTCMKYLKNEDDSKDAVMEIFEKSIHDLKKYDISNFKGWLYLKTRNFCLYKIRRQKKKNLADKKMQKDEKIFMENYDSNTLNSSSEARINKLMEAIEKLSADQKTCIKLFFFEKKTYQQIADATDLELNKVKSNIQNGKRNLKNLLEQTEAFQDDE